MLLYGVPASGGSAAPNATVATRGIDRQIVYNVLDYGAVGDGRVLTDGAMTSGAATFTSLSGAFGAGDLGKQVCIAGAGAAGANYKGTITAVGSSISVTLSANAGTTVAGAFCTIGTDDTAAIQAAIDACGNAGGGTVYRPVSPSGGLYLLNTLHNTAHDGNYNLALRKSNVRLLSEGPRAALQQGPGGCGAADTSKMVIFNDGSVDGTLRGLTHYPFFAAKRGDFVLSPVTAGDAAHFKPGDIVHIYATVSGTSGDYAELNVVTSVDPVGGTIGLQYALGKPYAQSAPYGVALATGVVLSDLAFEREAWRALQIFALGGGVVGCTMRDCDFDRQNYVGALGNAFGVAYMRSWSWQGCRLAYDNNPWQLAQGSAGLRVAGCTFIQRGTVAGAHYGIQLSENSSDVLFQGNYLYSAGSSDNGDALLYAYDVWDCAIAGNLVKVNANAYPNGMKAIFANNTGGGKTAVDLVIADNVVWGEIESKALQATIRGNRVTYSGNSQGIYCTGADPQSLIEGNHVTLTGGTGTAIYLENSGSSGHSHVVVGNKVIGDGTSGQNGIVVSNPGVVAASSPTIVGNHVTTCTRGIWLQSIVNVPAAVIGGNDVSGCTTPYTPVAPMGPPTAVTVGASPFTYTAGSATPEMVYLSGGTVTVVSKGATSPVTVFTASPCAVRLAPGEALNVTYSSAPTMYKERIA